MKGLTFKLCGIYFNCFRKPTTTSAILTYLIPPFTTIRGLIANILGMPRFPEYKVQLSLSDKLKIGIKPLNLIDKSTEVARILKLKGEGKGYVRAFPSSPTFKEFLVNPKYQIFITGDDNLLKQIKEKLAEVGRPLYLGQSDDMVDIWNVRMKEVKEVESNEIHSVLEGVYKNCEIVRLPYKFDEKGKNLEEKLISIPPTFPIKIPDKLKCCRFGDDNITLY